MQDFDPNSIRPTGNRVLIEEDENPAMSAGGIHLPSTARDAKFSVTATVLAVGPGKRLKSGQLVPIPLEKGDRVVLAKAHGSLVHGERVRLVDFDVIEGVA